MLRITFVCALTLLTFAAEAQDKSEIEKLNARFAELFNKGDTAGVAALYTDDAVVLPPGAGILKGKNDIEAFWKKAAETLGEARLTTVDVKPSWAGVRARNGPLQSENEEYPVSGDRGKVCCRLGKGRYGLEVERRYLERR
jgi:ketosteroid isomerase-like protein